jgi:hypothetical protein
MTVCLSRVSLCSKREEWKGTDAPLSVISEDCICLAEREELFPSLRLIVHIRVELFAQLQSKKSK